MVDLLILILIFWACIFGLLLFAVAWKQILTFCAIFFGIPLLIFIFVAEWTFDGGPQLKQFLGSILGFLLLCVGVYAMIIDLYKSSKERLQRRRAKKLENL